MFGRSQLDANCLPKKSPGGKLTCSKVICEFIIFFYGNRFSKFRVGVIRRKMTLFKKINLLWFSIFFTLPDFFDGGKRSSGEKHWTRNTREFISKQVRKKTTIKWSHEKRRHCFSTEKEFLTLFCSLTTFSICHLWGVILREKPIFNLWTWIWLNSVVFLAISNTMKNNLNALSILNLHT